MPSIFKFDRTVYLMLAVLALAAITCGPFGPQATPSPEPTGPGIADYGDAPDGDYGMDTGYYGFTGGPFVFTLDSMGVPASFPTVGDDPIPGPYMLDVDEFYIGPLFGSATAGDIPSMEDDVFDPNDPDGPPNLDNAKADCDKENASHNPGGTGCDPVPPYSIPMNGRLSIVFGFPPLGVFTTSVTVSDTVDVEGPAYWNFLIDLNQDGQWGMGEWVAQDVPVNLVPGSTQTLISPAFRWPTSGSPWGRLNFPLWARSMVTLDRVHDAVGGNWDGRGIEGGFSHGEVEDYFIEWRPMGQRFPGGGGGGGGGRELACTPASIARINCPDTVTTGVESVCGIVGIPPESIHVACSGPMENGGVVIDSGTVESGQEDVQVCNLQGFDIMATLDPGNLFILAVMDIPEDGQILISAQGSDNNECSGTGPVVIETGVLQLARLTEGGGGLDAFGLWLFESVVKEDNEEHHPFIQLLRQFQIWLREGSVHFEGDPPWVNVSGELNDDGTFSAEGRGVVAGFPDIAVTFEGQISNGTLTGDYVMGADGGLPGGESITYGITGTYQGPEEEPDGEEPLTSAMPETVMQTIDDFIQVFNQSFAEGDAGSLYQLLHPVVFDVYGEEACQAYLETVVGNPIQIELAEAWFDGPWDWVIDGITTPLEYIYTIVANRTVGTDTAEIEIHLYMPGDDSVRWLTDCGEPLE